MKPWQKRHFRLYTTEENLRRWVEKGCAKTEDEAYSLLKYQWKNATREIQSDGSYSITFNHQTS